MTAEMAAEPDHREFLYMGIGWMIMDLRQDYEFHTKFMDTPFPPEDMIERLYELEKMCGAYADQWFPVHPKSAMTSGPEDGF